MRFGIDVSSAAVGAGMTYAQNLLRALAEVDQENEYCVLAPASGRELGLELPSNFSLFKPPRIFASAPIRILFSQLWFPVWASRNHLDVCLFPSGYGVLTVSCRSVLLVQNASPYAGPSASTLHERWRERMIRWLAHLSARRAYAVAFVSGFARDLIAPRMKKVHRSHVIPYGILQVFCPDHVTQDSLNLVDARVKRPYILSVSMVRSHKDFATLLQAFAQAVCNKSAHSLVIAGAVVDRPYFESLETMISELGLGEQVIFLGDVAHDNMPTLYRGAEFSIFPSWIETFGLPVAESMACGTPVIASDIPASREVGGGAILYYTPGNVLELSRSIECLLDNDAMRTELKRRGLHRAKQYSWERAALQMRDLLVQAASRPRQLAKESQA